MKAIYKRELSAYFHSLSGYLFIAMLLFVAGLYTMSVNLTQSSYSFH